MCITVNAAILSVFLLSITVFGCDDHRTAGKKDGGGTILRTEDLAPADTSFKKFDIQLYAAALLKDAGYEGYQKNDSLYIQQSYTVREGEDDSVFDRTKVATYTNDLLYSNRYRTVKEYNHDGLLQHIKYYFATTLEIGLWQSFDVKGNVIAEDNKDADYQFSLGQVLAFGKANKVDFTNNGKVDRMFSAEYKKHVWLLEWNLEEGEAANQSIFRRVILDGNSGEILTDKKEMATLIRTKDAH